MAEPASTHAGDELVDLALGHVDAPRRAALGAHLLSCAACRADYDELSAAVTELVAATPPVQPPVGFDATVLSRLTAERTAVPARLRRQAWLGAAAALAVVLASLIGVLVVGNVTDDDGGRAGSVVPIRTTDDDRAVGTVSFADIDGSAVLVVAFVDAPADVSYRCQMHLRDGSTVTTEAWPASARGAWVVDVPGGDPDAIERIELVTADTGAVWSAAAL